MAAPTAYDSTDASAPSLTGTADSLRLLLKAVLVDGYGSKSAAGWTQPYTGTNKGAFKQGGGHQYYLRIDDSSAQMARVVGYKSMSDVDTGSEPFPTPAQFSDGLYARKSITADSTARPWKCWATDQAFILLMFNSITAYTSYAGSGAANLAFGQLIDSKISDDVNDAFLIASSDTSTSTTAADPNRESLVASNNSSSGTNHTFLLGSYTQASGAIRAYKKAPGAYMSATYLGAVTITLPGLPDVASGYSVLYPVVLLEDSGIVRGRVPGLMGAASFASSMSNFRFRPVTPLGEESGRSFFAWYAAGGSGAVLIETTGGW